MPRLVASSLTPTGTPSTATIIPLAPSRIRKRGLWDTLAEVSVSSAESTTCGSTIESSRPRKSSRSRAVSSLGPAACLTLDKTVMGRWTSTAFALTVAAGTTFGACDGSGSPGAMTEHDGGAMEAPSFRPSRARCEPVAGPGSISFWPPDQPVNLIQFAYSASGQYLYAVGGILRGTPTYRLLRSEDHGRTFCVVETPRQVRRVFPAMTDDAVLFLVSAESPWASQ